GAHDTTGVLGQRAPAGVPVRTQVRQRVAGGGEDQLDALVIDRDVGRAHPGRGEGDAGEVFRELVDAHHRGTHRCVGGTCPGGGVHEGTFPVVVWCLPSGSTRGAPETGSGITRARIPKTSRMVAGVITSAGVPAAWTAPACMAMR